MGGVGGMSGKISCAERVVDRFLNQMLNSPCFALLWCCGALCLLACLTRGVFVSLF